MDKQILINQLSTNPDLNQIIDEFIKDSTALNALFEIVITESSSIKYTCSKIVRRLSEQKPELIYPYFEDIVKWTHHNNSFIKWDGILTVSNLAAVDYEDKLKTIYQDYFALIHDPQMITAANVVGNAWKFVLAKPELESDITMRLLEVPNIIYINKGEPSPECNYIVRGKVLECFDHYFDCSGNQAAMIKFAEELLGCRRKSVGKNAEKFLRNHSGKRM